jgi:uncharacterized protein (TIGR03067 family)
MRRGVYLVALVGCVAILFPTAAAPVPKGPADTEVVSHWEHKAVSFGEDEKEGTKKLNDLARDGWEYVGPLGNGLVALKRFVLSPKDAAAKKELAKWEGDWEGDPGVFMTIKGDRFTSRAPGIGPRNGTLKIIEVGEKVTQVDLLIDEGDVKGQSCKAIFRLNGETLEYCVTQGETRPVEFGGDDANCYIPWKRAKK